MLHTYFWSLEKWLFLVQKGQDFPADIRCETLNYVYYEVRIVMGILVCEKSHIAHRNCNHTRLASFGVAEMLNVIFLLCSSQIVAGRRVVVYSGRFHLDSVRIRPSRGQILGHNRGSFRRHRFIFEQRAQALSFRRCELSSFRCFSHGNQGGRRT